MSDDPAAPEPDYRRQWEALKRTFSGVGFVFDREGCYVDVIARSDTEPLLYDDPDALVGRQLHEVFPDDRAEQLLTPIRRAIETGEVGTLEYQMDVQAGTRWFEAHFVPFTPSDGDEPFVQCFTRDVTERKRRERELERSERRFRALFEDPNVLIGILDVDGTLRRANRTALDLIDADMADLEGEPFPETPWWNHSEALQADLREWIERAGAGEYVEYRADHFTDVGERRTIDGVLRPVTNDGEVISIIASGRDVTDRERQQQRLQVLYRILRHNLRNGLNVIQGYADRIAAQEGETEPVRSMAERIGDRARDLTALATKVQRFRQLEATGTDRSVAVDELLDRVAADARDAHPDGRITVGTPDEDAVVPRPVELAVSEAVENAFEHHDRATPTVELAAEVVPDRVPPAVTLSIADDGPGITETESDPLVEGEETPLDHTSSVGLWLVKWIVEGYGGDLAIEDNDPRGSVVSLTIPLAAEAAASRSDE